jgi:hypothetical protein
MPSADESGPDGARLVDAHELCWLTFGTTDDIEHAYGENRESMPRNVAENPMKAHHPALITLKKRPFLALQSSPTGMSNRARLPTFRNAARTEVRGSLSYGIGS